MKFKRTIAGVLAAIFSLNLLGTTAPQTFAKGDSKTTEKIAEPTIKEETSQITDQLNKILKKLDEQNQLNELKEKIRELEEKTKDNNSECKNKKKKKSKNKEDKNIEKREENYFSKNGIKNVLNHFSKVFSAGVCTFFSECLLLSIPFIGDILVAPRLNIYHLGVLLPFIVMITIAIRLYENGCAQDNQNNNLKK